VHVLGQIAALERARAEPLHAPARVADGERDPRPEVVVQPPLLAALGEPGGSDLARRVVSALRADEHRVPGVGRVAYAEGAQDLLTQPALVQVLARLARLLRIPQVRRVELGRAVEQLDQPGVAPARLL